MMIQSVDAKLRRCLIILAGTMLTMNINPCLFPPTLMLSIFICGRAVLGAESVPPATRRSDGRAEEYD